MIAFKMRFLWRLMLILFGASMAWFSYAGLVEHLRPEIAVPVAITLPTVLSICFHLWHKTKAIKWALFSFSMVGMVGLVHGISSNTHLSHEDSDLARTVVTGAEASARHGQLDTARADHTAINLEVENLAAEAAALEAELPNISGLESAAAELEQQIFEMDNDGKRWNDAEIPALQARLDHIRGGISEARPRLVGQRAEIAGLRAKIDLKQSRSDDLATRITELSAGATAATATATATVGREKFLFQLASRLSGQDMLYTQGLLAIGGLAGGLLVELIYGFCWMVPVQTRRQYLAAIAEPDEEPRKSEPEPVEEPKTFSPEDFHVVSQTRFDLPEIYKNEEANPIAAQFADLEERLQSITVAELRSNTLSRPDEDKIVRRFNRFCGLGKSASEINKMKQIQLRATLKEIYGDYEDWVTVGEILAGSGKKAETLIAA